MEYRSKALRSIALTLGIAAAAPDTIHAYGPSYSTETSYAGQKRKTPQKPKKPANPLKGSRAALLEQNRMADKYGLSRIEDDKMLERFVREGYLVPLSRNAAYYLDNDLPDKYAYVRPWTKLFVDRLSSQYYAKFGERLKITSAVRTVKNQAVLDRIISAAAPARGPTASSHETGSTFDISKKDMSRKGRAWLQNVLGNLDKDGIIEATEERAAFHTMVYKDQYLAYVRNRK